MGQAGFSEQSELWMDENGRYPGHLALDEEIARHLQEEELIEDSPSVDVINNRELQIARDAELAHYMAANDGTLPEEFAVDNFSGGYHWAGKKKWSHSDAFADEELPIAPGAYPGTEVNGTAVCVACGDQNNNTRSFGRHVETTTAESVWSISSGSRWWTSNTSRLGATNRRYLSPSRKG
jgi:hypothetical protein